MQSAMGGLRDLVESEMQATITLERGTNKQNGFPVRLQKRGSKFDVVYCTGFCWKYVTGAKAVSEQTARNIFFLETL